MAKNNRSKATLKDAGLAKTVWEANPSFTMGEIKLNDFLTLYDAADTLDRNCAKADVELTGLKANRDDKARELRDLVTRFRSGIRACYGLDSPQYEQAGGTRISARKSPKAKASSAPAANPASA